MGEKFVFALVAFFLFLSACVDQPIDQSLPQDQPFEPEVVLDPCENISCNDYCDGTTFFYEGKCVQGSCTFLKEENSLQCGFAPEQKYNLKTDFRECRFDKTVSELSLFFTIRNVGETVVPKNSSIWLLGEDINRKVFDLVNKDYGFNQVLWGTVRHDAWSYQGQLWTIREVQSPTSIGDIKLVLCEDVDVLFETCKEEEGIVLFEGNAVDLCFSELELDLSCSVHEDCILIDLEGGLKCCQNTCPTDVSKESVVSINKSFFENLSQENCVGNEACQVITCALSADFYEAKCFSGVCSKRESVENPAS